jgi:hypothetical protein
MGKVVGGGGGREQVWIDRYVHQGVFEGKRAGVDDRVKG